LRPSPVTARRDVVGALHAWQAPDDRHAASGNGIGRDNRLRQDDPPLIAARVRAGHQFGQIWPAFTFQVAGSAIWISRQYPKSRVSVPESEISVSSCRASIRAAPMDISAIGSPSSGISAIRHCPLGLRRRETRMFCARSPRPAVVAIVMSVRGIAPLNGRRPPLPRQWLRSPRPHRLVIAIPATQNAPAVRAAAEECARGIAAKPRYRHRAPFR
jgi:hypothetical protein